MLPSLSHTDKAGLRKSRGMEQFFERPSRIYHFGGAGRGSASIAAPMAGAV
jgi:hypothetical protein